MAPKTTRENGPREQPASGSSQVNPKSPAVPDFTGDGVPDLAAVQQNRTNLGPA